MAKTPTPTSPPGNDKRDREQDMFMREVDEAVRQDEVTNFAKKYGWPLGIAFVAIMAAYGGWLFWNSSSEAAMEERSEALVQAIDELEAGNMGIADGELAFLSGGDDGVAAAAAMLRAGIAIEQDRPEDAAALFDQVANNADLPAEIRDIAAIRSVSVMYDTLDPADIIARIGPIAVPGNPYYGSAGELVAHAYLAQGQEDQAGSLLVAISQDDNVPSTLRGRTRQLAGMLGFDAIDDVDAALAEITGNDAQGPAVELVE